MVGGVAFVETCEDLQTKYPLFGGKGVHNSFCLQTEAHFSYHYGSYNIALSSVLSHVSFSHLLPSAQAHRHGINYRIYLALGALRNTVTRLMYSQRQYQRVRHYCQVPLSGEAWQYLGESLQAAEEEWWW